MEKYSAYRDPGTGIQPFLTPVPPVGSDLLDKITLPLRFIFGVVRTTLVLVLLVVYVTIVQTLCFVLIPVPPLRRAISHLLTAIIARVVLLLLGFFWISVEQVRRKKGRGNQQGQSWHPQARDIIVSNWASWIELLWLAFRFDPIFVLPIPESLPATSITPQPSTLVTHTPGRRTGTGSANVQSPRRVTNAPIRIVGYKEVSLLCIIQSTGRVPPFEGSARDSPLRSLEDIRKRADRPVVVFPECTTSNGRGLLRFADVFGEQVPIKNYQVCVMCVRYDPPTVLAPTMTRSIPSTSFNPIAHLFTITTSISLPTISIRLLVPSDSPSSQLFIPSEVMTEFAGEDQLTEACATLTAQIGKLKRMGMGWEDKASFLDFYRGKCK